MINCAALQERLAEEGASLLERDATLGAHVASCPRCRAFLEALEQLDPALAHLSRPSAPEALIERTARAVTGPRERGEQAFDRDPGAQRLASALAAGVIVVASYTLVQPLQPSDVPGDVFTYVERSKVQEAVNLSSPNRQALGVRGLYDGRYDEDIRRSKPSTPEPVAQAAVEDEVGSASELREELPAYYANAPAMPVEPSMELGAASEILAKESNERADWKKRDRVGGGKAKREQRAGAGQSTRAGELDALLENFADALLAAPRQSAPMEPADDMPASLQNKPAPRKNAPASAAVAGALVELKALESTEEQLKGRYEGDKLSSLAMDKDVADDEQRVVGRRRHYATPDPRETARRFLDTHEMLQGLKFQPTAGYWANTYVPGDPAIRLLEARLQRWNRGNLARVRLEAAARQNWQPFDPPRNAALAAYLHADKAAIDAPTRLRIQVGLKGTQRRSGLRPSMNVGLVLDLRRPLDAGVGASLRALVMALSQARQPGDRFSLTVAGHPGGLLVPPENFRHGPLRLAMETLFGASGEPRVTAMDLLAALRTATDRVRAGDDPDTPLGASLVLLASTVPFDEQRADLERLAHENAVAGINLSVVSVGDRARSDHIDRLVLLGQGHRRVLGAGDDAARLVDRELHASSRAVARAVRLRIRLAPGVELIDVLGSRSLAAAAAQRVREAERSIDQRLARNLGIRADRGDDEEGIQIVIPSFFAGDSHTILLDVVARGPGPVADLSVRYKDLVYRRNGVARARLALDSGDRVAGPLERNVLKNHLAHVLAVSAERAGRQLAEGDTGAAARELASVRALLEGMRLEIPGWGADAELLNDEAMLAEYLAVLGSHYPGAAPQRRHLADSLRYLAFRRLMEIRP